MNIKDSTAIWLAALLLAGSLALSPAALGAERVALVIGNAAYEDAPLRNPVNDARAMGKTLERLGFEIIQVENATKTQMERALVDFTSRLDDGASGLFYYAGHGIQVRGRNYLVPVGTRFKSQQEARIESVAMDLVLNELAYAGNRLNIVILDACRNNPFERRLRGGSRGLAAIDAARGTLIAYATAPGSVALDGDGRNGLYTEELLRALAEPGLKIEQVFKKVRVGVARRTDEQQIPWESSSLIGDFVFNRVAMNASASETTSRRNETLFWESAQRIDTIGAYRAYLDKYPAGEFAGLAAIRVAALDSEGGGAATAGAAVTGTGQASASTPQLASPTPATDVPSDEGHPRRKIIAILPFEGRDFGCYGADFESASVVRELRDHLFSSEIDVTLFRYLGWMADASPGDLWREDGLFKRPIPELVYEHGEGLEVDGMLLVWFKRSGSSTCRVDYELHLYDVELRTAYTDSATETDLIAAARNLAALFIQQRMLAGR